MAVFGAKPVAEVDLGFKDRRLTGPPRLVWRSNQSLRRRFWELSSQRLGTDHCGGLTLAGLGTRRLRTLGETSKRLHRRNCTTEDVRDYKARALRISPVIGSRRRVKPSTGLWYSRPRDSLVFDGGRPQLHTMTMT
jgi:hypothetical protein